LGGYNSCTLISPDQGFGVGVIGNNVYRLILGRSHSLNNIS